VRAYKSLIAIAAALALPLAAVAGNTHDDPAAGCPPWLHGATAPSAASSASSGKAAAPAASWPEPLRQGRFGPDAKSAGGATGPWPEPLRQGRFGPRS